MNRYEKAAIYAMIDVRVEKEKQSRRRPKGR
jgi:hypothetical protein